MSQEKYKLSLSIELLPEFGWSVNDQPVYGPGSVFQGFIRLKLSQPVPIDNVRIAFYASETVPPYDVRFGSMRAAKHVLFSTQITLWESIKDKALPLDNRGIATFPFTIQMPMVQFPPSLDSKHYKSKFQLIAIVDAASRTIKHSKSVLYMPYVETSLLKAPLLLSANGSLSAQLKMTATEFVPGDIIPLSLHVGRSGPSKKARYVTVRLQLIQKIAIRIFDDFPVTQNTVASVSHKLLLIPNLDGSFCDGDFSLPLPAELPPTFDYGNLAHVSYRLQVTVEQKGPLSAWNYITALEDVPIKMGTLGYGIRVSDEFVNYSQFELSKDKKRVDMPYPKFMKSIEYEDALPLYDATRLPEYQVAIC